MTTTAPTTGTPDPASDHERADTQSIRDAGGPNSCADHAGCESQGKSVGAGTTVLDDLRWSDLNMDHVAENPDRTPLNLGKVIQHYATVVAAAEKAARGQLAPNINDGHARPASHDAGAVVEQSSRPTTLPAIPTVTPSVGTPTPSAPAIDEASASLAPPVLADPNIDTDHESGEAHGESVGVEQPPGRDQVVTDDQIDRVPAGPLNIGSGQRLSERHGRPATAEQNIRDGHSPLDLHSEGVVAEQTLPAPATIPASAIEDAPVLADPILALSAEVLDDIERTRNNSENRLRQLTRVGLDKDGGRRGFALPPEHPAVQHLALQVRGMLCDSDVVIDLIGPRPPKKRGVPCCQEHDATQQLEKLMRAHPLGAWVARTKGVGDKQAARLLGAISDPYWNDKHNRPRQLSELFSYCGLGDAQKQVRRRGVKANWSDTAKKRAWLISKSSIRTLRAPCHVPEGQAWAEHVKDCACGPYRLVYDATREAYADTVHPHDCVRCGPSGSPALAGTPRSAGHLEAIALRAMSKQLLADLWREARDLHNAAPR